MEGRIQFVGAIAIRARLWRRAPVREYIKGTQIRASLWTFECGRARDHEEHEYMQETAAGPVEIAGEEEPAQQQQ